MQGRSREATVGSGSALNFDLMQLGRSAEVSSSQKRKNETKPTTSRGQEACCCLSRDSRIPERTAKNLTRERPTTLPGGQQAFNVAFKDPSVRLRLRPGCYTTSAGTSPVILTIIATIISIFLQPRPGRREVRKRKSVTHKR